MTHIMSIFKWILSTSLMASVLVFLILIIRFLIKGKLSPRWQYMLWFLLIFRLLLPWTPQSTFSIFNVLPANQFESSPYGQEIVLSDAGIVKGTLQDIGIITDSSAREPGQTSSKNIQGGQSNVDGIRAGSIFSLSGNFLTVLFFIWLSGMLFMSVYILLKNFRIASRIRKGSSDIDQGIMDILKQCKDRMSIGSDIKIVRTGAVTSPTLYGFVNPKILLPLKGMDALDQNEWRYVFVHELAHFKRKDIMANCLSVALVIIHWFNPVIIYGFKRMRDDQEIACDSMALSCLGDKESQNYGYTMIKLLENSVGSLWKPSIASFSANKSQLKRRITMIKLFKNGAYRLSVIGLVLMIALAGCTLTNGKTSPDKPGASAPPVQQSDSGKPANSAPEANNGSDLPKGNDTSSDSQNKTANPMFKSIYMVNKQSGFGMSNSAIYRTADSGKTWADITPEGAVLTGNNNEIAARFAYIDENTGFLAVPKANEGKVIVYRTADGGRKWTKSEVSNTFVKSPYISAIDFADKNHGWLMLSYGLAMGSEPVEVFRTVDGGSTWDKVAGANQQTGQSGYGLSFGGLKTGLKFIDKNNGYVTGFDYGDNLYLYSTLDGGSHWQRQQVQIAKGYTAEAGSAQTMAPFFFSAKEGLMPVVYHTKGQATFFYSTEDGGKTWQIPSNPISSDNNNSFIWSFPDRMHGFATEGSGLYVTKDGAKSWSKITYDSKDFQNISTIDFVSENDGFAIGNGFLLRTTDGGKTWLKSTNVNN